MMADKEQNKAEENDRNEDMKWMIRPCDVYEDEYSDCTSIKARFHQYFIHGETTNCNSWKTDLDNCLRWRDEQSHKAYEELIASEQNRRVQRLLPHFKNDTWKKRSCPPSDWSKPLPAWLEEENKNTFLGLKAEEVKNSGQPDEGERSLCIIS